jgi:hypothetical protein
MIKNILKMSQSFILLRNQLNNSREMIRPLTFNIIDRVISEMERVNEESTVLYMSNIIVRLEMASEGDISILSDFIDDNRVANSVSIPILQNFLNQIRNFRADIFIRNF